MRTHRPFPAIPFLLCAIGLAFCLWVNLSGGTALCLTDGCALFQDFSLAGVSLWKAGASFFGFMLLLCVLRFSGIALFCAGLALAADILLMAIMSFTAPCVNCLLVGLLIALTFFALLRETALHKRARRSPLLLVWALFFTISAGGLLKDGTKLWSPLPYTGQEAVQVFFSPSCRACQSLTEQADALPDAAWFPVAEDSRDIWLIHAMNKHLASGLPLREAISKAHANIPGLADAPDLMALPAYRLGLLKPEMLLLQFRLWKNRAHVLAADSDRLPFVQFKGLPSFLNGEKNNVITTPERGTHSPAEVPGIDLGVAGFCGGEKKKEDCESNDSTKMSHPYPSGPIDTSGM